MKKLSITLQMATLIVLALTLAIGANYFLNVHYLEQATHAADKARAESVAASVNALVKNHGDALLGLSRTIRTHPLTAQATAASGRGNAQALDDALRSLAPEPGAGSLMVIDINKTVTYRAHRTDVVGDKMDFPGLAEALSGKEVIASHRDAGSQRVSVHVMSPIVLPNRKIAGVLVLAARFDDAFAGRLAAEAGAGVSFASDKGVWASSAPADAKNAAPAHLENIARRVRDKANVYLADSAAGTAWLYAPLRSNVVNINDETATLIVRIDTSASAQRLRDQSRALMWASMVLLIVCAGLGVVMAVYLTRPRRLQEELQRLSRLSSGSGGAARDMNDPANNMNALQVAAKLLAQHADESRAAREKAEFSAQYDALTKLPNRTLMRDRLNLAVAGAARNQSLVAFMFIDLDKFKPINDTLGHDVGDQVLQEAASRLRDCVREQDTVARLGGDEFVVILPQMKHTEDAAIVARNILTTVNLPSAFTGSSNLHVSASIGIGIYPVDAQNVDELIKCADAAMYHTKELGRNGYQFFAPEMNARVNETQALETDLRLALERNEFELHYQPQVSLASGQIIGVEALLRWRHPQRGLLAPADFLPLAEKRGLAPTIGEWVLRTACRQNRQWQEDGLMRAPVAVNVSLLQLSKSDFPGLVTQVLLESGLAPQYLELEIDESVLHDSASTRTAIGLLKSVGVTLSIDDFGTGYSALGFLKRLPISKLKIDQSFVGNIPGSEDDAAIVNTIIAMALGLKLEVVAEGVETAAQVEFLIAAGCRDGQGHYFGKAMPADEFRQLIGQSLPVAQAA